MFKCPKNYTLSVPGSILNVPRRAEFWCCFQNCSTNNSNCLTYLILNCWTFSIQFILLYAYPLKIRLEYFSLLWRLISISIFQVIFKSFVFISIIIFGIASIDILMLCLFEDYWFSRSQWPRRDSRSNGTFPYITVRGLQKLQLVAFSTENHKLRKRLLKCPTTRFLKNGNESLIVPPKKRLLTVISLIKYFSSESSWKPKTQPNDSQLGLRQTQ